MKYVSRRYLIEKWASLKWDMEGLLTGDFDEVNYLYETIRMKSLLSKQEVVCNIESYKCVLYSYLVLGLDKTLEKMAYNPRRILRINNKKMINVALDEYWVVAPSLSKSKCKISPYKGMKLKGKIINEH